MALIAAVVTRVRVPGYPVTFTCSLCPAFSCYGGAGDDRLIVTKQPRWSIKRDTQGTEGESQVHDLFSGLASSHELTSISGSLNLVLSLGEPVHRSLVEKVEDPRGRRSWVGLPPCRKT